MMQRLSPPLLAGCAACLTLLAALTPTAPHAEAELFRATEATRWAGTLPLPARFWKTPDALVEPASGDAQPAADAAPEAPAEASPEAHSEAHSEANAGTHGATPPDAHGEAAGAHGGAVPPASHSSSEGEKSFSGKDLTGPRALPLVTIGGTPVQRHVDMIAKAEEDSTPMALRQRGMDQVLMRRISLTPFAHNPRHGPADARVQVVVLEDLGCESCWPAMTTINTTLQDYASSTQVVWIHTPSQRLQPTNMAAFYGKVAAKNAKFWEYRAAVLENKPKTSALYFELLAKLGLDPRDIRETMRTDARRFYREMDADTLTARTFGFDTPPMVLVNGIVVGHDGLPLDLLNDVLAYVHARIARGLNEPPR